MKLRHVLIAFALGAALMASVPVIADHVTEPTRPIDGVAWKLYEYGNQPATLLTACNGTETFAKEDLRIDLHVRMLDVDDRDPSAHFNIIVTQNLIEGQAKRYIWRLLSKHSNVPPHDGHIDPSFPNYITWQWAITDQSLIGYEGTMQEFVFNFQSLEADNRLFTTKCKFRVADVLS